MIDRLIEGNISNNVECLENVENLLMTLYKAWKDVIENPRPDGVPSPRLQPDEFKKFQDEHAGEPTKNAKEATDDRPQLKLMA